MIDRYGKERGEETEEDTERRDEEKRVLSLGRDLRRGGEGRENRNKQLRRKDFGILSGCNENKKKFIH